MEESTAFGPSFSFLNYPYVSYYLTKAGKKKFILLVKLLEVYGFRLTNDTSPTAIRIIVATIKEDYITFELTMYEEVTIRWNRVY